MSSNPVAFAQLFGQLGQAMQHGAANASASQDASHDNASQQFQGAFTELFAQLGQAMQNSAANLRVVQNGANQPFRFNTHGEFQSDASSWSTPSNTNREAREACPVVVSPASR